MLPTPTFWMDRQAPSKFEAESLGPQASIYIIESQSTVPESMHSFDAAVRAIKDSLTTAHQSAPARKDDIRAVVMFDVDVNLRKKTSRTRSARAKPRKTRPLLAWISTRPDKRYAFLPRKENVFATGFVLRE